MDDIVIIPDSNVTRWVRVDEHPLREDVVARATVDVVATAVAHLGNVDVHSVRVNRSGSYDSPQGRVTGLPDFCDVELRIRNPGGHVAHVTVWAPLRWNGRFLGTTGGGNRTAPQWIQGDFQKSPTMVDGVRNGFAAACTDGGNRDTRPFSWALDESTGELDVELMTNWLYRSTHEMTLAAKSVIEALYDEQPAYSYLVGSSGGGRQTLAIAQRYPGHYDGYWAADPAVNWAKLHVAQLWPAVVMKEERTCLSRDKQAAFRRAALAAFDALDGAVDGVINSVEFLRWDASSCVGLDTPDGPITIADAKVMQAIWDGPTDPAGNRLWYGVPIAAESWGAHYTGLGLTCVDEVDGRLEPSPFPLSVEWIGAYVFRDPKWDWRTLDTVAFSEVFRRSVSEFGEYDSSDPDFSGLKGSGGKLILSHGMADEGIPPEGTLDYYRRIVSATGDEDGFLRFFLCPGDVHASITGAGPGISMAAGIAALMAWVEDDLVPDVIHGTRMDTDRNVTMSRPIRCYPHVAEYLGGDPGEASSFAASLDPAAL